MADSFLIELLWDYLQRDREHSDRRRTSYGTKTKAGLTESVRRIVVEEPTPTGRDREIIALLWNYLPRVPEHRDRRMTGWGSKTEQGLLASVYSAVTEGSQNPASVIPRIGWYELGAKASKREHADAAWKRYFKRWGRSLTPAQAQKAKADFYSGFRDAKYHLARTNPASVISRTWIPARVRRLKSGQVQVAVTGRGRR